MKTFSKTVTGIITSPIKIAKTATLFVLMLILAPYQVFSQGTLTGFVVDEEFNTPLEKAVVTIPETLISVLTDQQGKYTIELISGDYLIEINCPGYFGRKFNMSTSDGIHTPMSVIKLKANLLGRTLQRGISSFENKRQFSQSIEDFSIWQVAEQTGHQEFNELFRTIPSVTFLSNGNGYNDSEISFRGNESTNSTYTFNGILLNNPETGRVGSSLLSGLTDWAGQIQVSNGQPANLQSQARSGGLISVLSFAPKEEFGTEVLAIYGAKGLLKTTATVHSGNLKNKLAVSLQISRTSGNGLVQNTAFEQYGAFLNIQKEFNHQHTLMLNLYGTLQQHDINTINTIASYNRFGTDYNKNWGYLNEQKISWSTNFGRSPMISLTHSWQTTKQTNVRTLIFAQINQHAQLMPGGSVNNLPVEQLPRDNAGLVPFVSFGDWNMGLQVKELGANRVPDASKRFYNTASSGISTLARINNENRFGLRSVLTHNFSKKLNFTGSFDLEQYHASHFGTVKSVLGADGYISYSDINRPAGFVIENLFQASLFPKFNSADKASYFYESGIQTGGLSLRLNYQTDRFYWHMEGSASLQNIRRTDHFNYLVTDAERQTELTLFPGWRAQTGIRINLWKYHSIHLHTNYGSYQPLFTKLFPSGNNWKNEQATNELVFDAEVGYTVFSRRLKVEAVAYRSQIANRQMVRYSNLNPGDSFGVINGLSELHQGVELKTSYKITRNIQLNLNGSLGDWKYAKDAKAQIYDSNNLQIAENELWIKDIKIANAPQLSLFTEVEWRWAHNFYARINYSHTRQIYAPFGIYDFKNLSERNDFEQWEMPSFSLLGASGNYLYKINKWHTLNLIFGASNLLDTEYIEQTATNIPEEKSSYINNQVYYGMGRTWFVGIKYQFGN